MFGLEAILGGALAAIVAAVGMYFAGRRKGRLAEQQKQEARKAEAMRARREIDNEVDGMDDYRARSELDRWLRGDE